MNRENEIQTFESQQFGRLRGMNIQGQPWFVGKDVAVVLGYAKARNAIEMHVDEDDALKQGLTDSLGRTQQTIFINESGLYSLILSSKLPQAKAFKHWVTSEVLPQIRRTGGYIPTHQEDDEKSILCRALQILQRTIEQREARIADLEPEAKYCEEVLTSPSCYTMTEVAKGLGLTVHELTRRLRAAHVLFRSPGGMLMLYAPYQGQGLEAYRTRQGRDLFGQTTWTDSYLVWTERGRRFVREKAGEVKS